jgi:hypothetical protein
VLSIGDVIKVGEADYRYGTGELHMRVTHVPKEIDTRGLEWVQLMGVEIRWDGSDGKHRNAWVRVAGLRKP